MKEDFPYIQCLDYSNIEEIRKTFPHLQSINQKKDWSDADVYGIIIRISNDDNIHKSIKYGVWTSTLKNSQRLNQIFQEAKQKNKEIYLFFSVMGSGMFSGVAKMKTVIYFWKLFPYWWGDYLQKFKGTCRVEWIYIKDVRNQYFSKLDTRVDVDQACDCFQLNLNTTKQMLQIFSDKPRRNKWIFNDFKFFDEREQIYTRKLQGPILISTQIVNNTNVQ